MSGPYHFFYAAAAPAIDCSALAMQQVWPNATTDSARGVTNIMRVLLGWLSAAEGMYTYEVSVI